MVDTIFRAIGSLSIRFRWLVLLAWVLGAVAALTLLPSLSSVTQSDNVKFLPPSAPSARAAELAAPFNPGGDLTIPVIVATSGSVLTPADGPAITGLEHRLARVAIVRRVLDAGRARDGQAEQLVVFVPQSQANGPQIETMASALRAAFQPATLRAAGLRAHLAGQLADAADVQKSSGNTTQEIFLVSALFVIVLLVLIFRSFTLALTTLLPAALSAVIAGPLVAEAAHHGLQVSPIAQELLTVLVIGAGTDYGLFLVFRAREELRRGNHRSESYAPEGGLLRSAWRDLARPRDPAREAITWALTKVGESITFSAATVIAAVLTLTLATFPFYSNLGVPFAIAVAVILLAALTLLPALLSLRLSALAVKRTVFTAWFGRAKLLPWNIQGTGEPGTWGRIAGRIVRRPAAVLAIGIVVFGGLSFAVLGYAGGGFGGNTAAPAGSDSAAGDALLAHDFPQSSANPTPVIFRFAQPVWDKPAVLAATAARLSASGVFTKVTGPLDPAGVPLTPAEYAALHTALGPAAALPPVPPPGTKVPALAYEIYRASGNDVSRDGRTVAYDTALRAGEPGTTAAMDAVPSIRAAATAAARAVGATASGVGGESPAFYDINSLSNRDLTHIVPIAILAIGILLALVLRSLVAPLYLIASVGISYLAALGLSVVIFIEFGGDNGLVFFLPFLMFIFLLALGEDYNILVMTRIREEASKRPLREAVSTALTATGTTVTSAGLVLAGTFASFGLVAGLAPGGSEILPVAIGLALGILMDTFLVRTLLVPSTVVLLGRWNWWPSRLGQHGPGAGDGAAGIPTSPGLPGASGHAHQGGPAPKPS